jgi:hypothetical protein
MISFRWLAGLYEANHLENARLQIRRVWRSARPFTAWMPKLNMEDKK